MIKPARVGGGGRYGEHLMFYVLRVSLVDVKPAAVKGFTIASQYLPF